MSKTIKIPASMNPFVVIVNGVKHEYPAGETVEVPDHIAEIIEQYEKGNFPQPVAPTNAIKLLSPNGTQFLLTVSDEGEFSVEPFAPEGMIAFYCISAWRLAPEGMTWKEWLESDYNTVKYRCETCGEMHSLLGVFANMVCYAVCDGEGNTYDDGPVVAFSSKENYDNGDFSEDVRADDQINAGYWYC